MEVVVAINPGLRYAARLRYPLLMINQGDRGLVARGGRGCAGSPCRPSDMWRLRGHGRRRRVASSCGTAATAWRGHPAAVPWSETSWELSTGGGSLERDERAGGAVPFEKMSGVG
jgi:hypothetical protein